uniref:Protein kinase domain-containing protein n=1 Tax=Corethron hystrix TaxID=216773 RepID=A0A7S1B3D7_9STRA|mmetsp:Transcript_10257/g.22764  ORF Transcript_10257/g.22764 Transcript_10257/m.22764 type:complete len:410 (+) Transcript_10257:176-1405(+)
MCSKAEPYNVPDRHTFPNASASFRDVSLAGQPSEALSFPEATIRRAKMITALVHCPERLLSAEIDILLRVHEDGTLDMSAAYWPTHTLKTAIFGRVRKLVLLRKRSPALAPDDHPSAAGSEWEITPQKAAVKEMSWSKIMRKLDKSSCDALREIKAMQYLMSPPCGSPPHHNVLSQIETLCDDDYLYSIMPYCSGGDLFDRVSQDERFTDPQARYWFRQLLQGLLHLQSTGVSHRDLSLENFLLDGKRGVIMDFDLAVRVPYSCPYDTGPVDHTHGSLRLLLPPMGSVGKWKYMAPEIKDNAGPFDGFAVDLWSVGVILFTMLAGIPPFQFASLEDPLFRLISGGYLRVLVEEWKLNFSAEAIDLLQGMFKLRPKDRLTLQEVMEHPWVTNGEVMAPTTEDSGNEDWRN